MEDLQDSVRRLLDRAELSDLVHRYAMGIDLRDWTLYRSCFDRDLTVTFVPEIAGVPNGAIAADDWVAMARGQVGTLRGTQHLCSVYATDIDGDSAEVTSYYQAAHFEPSAEGDATFVHRGLYHGCARTSQGWKILAVHAQVLWGEGNRAVIDHAVAGTGTLGSGIMTPPRP